MSTPTRKVVPTISATSPVTELIAFLRYAFQDSEFAQVKTILVNRENGFKTELENLRNDNKNLKEKHDLMEKNHGLAELAKVKYEAELIASRRECDELKSKLLRLIDAQKVAQVVEFTEKMKGLEGKKIKTENLDMVEEKPGLPELAKLRYEAELMATKRECDELKGKLLRLNEDHKVLIDARKMAEEKLVAAEKDKTRMVAEFGKVLEGEKHKREELVMENRGMVEENLGLLKLAKATYEAELVKWKRECDELKEKFTRLNEDHKVSIDARKMAEEKLLGAEKDKSRMVEEFTEKIKVLEGEKHGREKIIKKNHDMVEENLGLVKLAKARYEARKSECDELKAKLVRLNEDHKVLNDEKKKSEERMKVLEVEKLEKEKALKAYKRSFYALDERMLKLDNIIAKVTGSAIKASKEEANVAEEKNVTASEGGKECTGKKISPNGLNVKGGNEIFGSPHANAGSGNEVDSRKEGSHPTDSADIGSPTETRTTSEPRGPNKEYDGSKTNTGQLESAPMVIDLSESDDDDDDMPTRETISFGETRKRSASESEDDDHTPSKHKTGGNSNRP